MICLTIAGQSVEVDNEEIVALVADLGLVSGKRRPFFCELYRQAMTEKAQMSKNLQRELYLRNRKFSRYVYASLIDSPERFRKR